MALIAATEELGPPPRISHWQQGCDDAKADRLPDLPAPRVGFHGQLWFQPERDGYMNGYHYGKRSRNVLKKYQGGGK